MTKRKVTDYQPDELYWNQVASIYDTLYQDRWSQLEDEFVRQELRDYQGTALDIGCGTGLGYALLPDNVHYTGIDFAPKMISIARQKYPAIQFEVMDATAIRYPPNSFDAVISLFSSLSFIQQTEQAFYEALRVLKARGRFFFMVLNQDSLAHRIHRSNGLYSTRHSDPTQKTPIYTYPLDTYLSWLHQSCSIVGLSLLGGLYESPRLWQLDRLVSHYSPRLTHTLILTGMKNA